MNHPTPNTWLDEIDIMRGMAIMAVVMIHLTGLPVRVLTVGQWSHSLYAILNSLVQFAVPAFIFISALVLTYGTRKKESLDWKQFYIKRWWQVVVPYLLWTVFYIGYRVFTTPYAINEVQSLKFWAYWLLMGKAYYHLYYLSLIIQFYVFFPLLYSFLNRIRWNFFLLLPLAALVQVGIYWANRLYFCHAFPYGKPFIWYLFVILIGMWIGGNYDKWQAVIKERLTQTVILLVALGFGIYYIKMSLDIYFKVPISTFVYQMVWYLYVTAFSLTLLELSRRLANSQRQAVHWLQGLGELSFGIYLIHPLLLAEWRRIITIDDPVGFHLLLWLSFILVIALSGWLVTRVNKTRWRRYLWGR